MACTACTTSLCVFFYSRLCIFYLRIAFLSRLLGLSILLSICQKEVFPIVENPLSGLLHSTSTFTFLNRCMPLLHSMLPVSLSLEPT
ncbi:hypothetical protein FGO68_gene7678 [Halteria grandinella]|uniref:Uncharacterized protein n=1 Tax=Halteria grandinella TaxID=5974 RepID=A0A8J8P2B9_HALGN|nr:hypothetical protein FGO68_gene7678 [Halteria grandinella]